MGTRLNKFIAECSGLSRRKADDAIKAGQVNVNGKVATLGQIITPDKDTITLKGKKLVVPKKLYVLFHKPKGVITTRSDEKGRKTIYDVLPDKYHHLDPAGRLDRNTSGLLILSNDGDFLQHISHPKYKHKKTYRVTLHKALTKHALKQIDEGILLPEDNKVSKMTVHEIREDNRLILSLKTGYNRQIHRSFETLGYSVTDLKRLSVAHFQLGKLPISGTKLLRASDVAPILK